MRAFLSLVIAIVLSTTGHLLVWGGGSTLARLQQQGALHEGQALVPSILVALGVVCLAGAMLTAAWSSVGVILVGLVQALIGIGIVVLPVAIYAGAVTSVERVSRPVGDGLLSWWASGLGLVTGLVFFVGGIAAAARRPRATAAGRVTTTILSIALGVGVLLLLAYGGASLIRSIVQSRGAVEVLGVLLVLAAAVLIVIVVAGVRFSSLGAIVAGVLIAGLGGLLLWAPDLVLRPILATGRFAVGLGFLGDAGGLLVLGVLLFAAGIAGLIRARRTRAATAAELEIEEHIGYQVEEPAEHFPLFPATTDAAPERTAEPPADRV